MVKMGARKSSTFLMFYIDPDTMYMSIQRKSGWKLGLNLAHLGPN